VKIIDSKTFPRDPDFAAIVTLKPGGLRELHWHPNADEWQYYMTGKGRMTVFTGATTARTMDFEEGDIGYVPISNPHYIENTGDSDLVFIEMFRASDTRTSRSRMDGAYATPADESASRSDDVHARYHSQTGGGGYTSLDVLSGRDLNKSVKYGVNR